VGAQYCGALGKRAHCQSGVFIGYSSLKGHALLESRLYLPPCWFEPEFVERYRQCRIPKQTTFQTREELALELLGRLGKTQQFGGRWIACDGSFENQERLLEQLPQDFYYLAEMACARKVWVKEAGLSERLKTEGCTLEQLLQAKPLLDWQTYSLSLVAMARVRVYASAQRTARSERWLLLREDANGQIRSALSNTPEDTPTTELVRVSGALWPLAGSFQRGPSQLGLEHYEHRSWTAWHRHMRLAFLAQLFVLCLQNKCNTHSGVELDATPLST